MIGKLVLAGTLAIWVALPVVTLSVAHAQEDADKAVALAAYKKGTIQYNLGNWDKAIGFFTTAFETYPDAAFLFNIAQSHRQARDCKQSAFFYKRYLAIKPDASNRDEVEGFIKELETVCVARDSATDVVTTPGTGTAPGPDAPNETKPATSTDTPAGTTTTTGTGTTEVAASTDTTSKVSGGITSDAGPNKSLTEDGDQPKLLVAYGSVGTALVSAGDLESAAQINLTASAGYPIQLGSIRVDVGALVSQTRANWDASSASGTASFTQILANVGGSMEIIPKLRARAELGVGAMIYSGLDVPGNIFVADGMAASGALSTASFRVSLGAEYALTSNLAVSAQPIIISVSQAASGMRDSIEHVSSYQALIGLGYSM